MKIPNWVIGPTALATLFLLLPFLALGMRVQWSEVWYLLGQESSRQALQLSLLTSGCATILCLVLGLPLALWLAGRKSGIWAKILQTAVTLPMVLPPVVAGLVLLITWGRRGLLGQHLAVFGVEIGFTTLAVILAQSFVSLPFFVTSLTASLRAKGTVYEQTAHRLGASPNRILFSVTLPLSVPALIGALCLAFARALGEFGATLTFAGSLPGVTRTLPLEIYLQRENDTDTALALALLLLVIALILLGASQFVDQIKPKRWAKQFWNRGPHHHSHPAQGSSIPTGDPNETDAGGDRITVAPRAYPGRACADKTCAERLHSGQATSQTHTRKISGSQQIKVHLVVPERGVDYRISIPRGQTTVLIGGNGAGKSTLLEYLSGFLDTEQSQVDWGGFSTNRPVLLEQNPNLFPHLTLLENVAFPLCCRGMKKDRAHLLAASYLERVNLSEISDRYPDQISGGQAQKTAVARALTLNPEVLLLDEPFAGIDQVQTAQIRDFLRTQLGDVTLILVTHDLRDAKELADQVVVLEQGCCLVQGTWSQVMEKLMRSDLLLQMLGQIGE